MNRIIKSFHAGLSWFFRLCKKGAYRVGLLRLRRILFLVGIAFICASGQHIIYRFLLNHGIETHISSLVGFGCIMLLATVMSLLFSFFEKRKRSAKIMRMWKQQAEMIADDDYPNVLTVNSALEHAVSSEGTDREALQIVIRFASRLEIKNGFEMPHIKSPMSKIPFSGYTVEMGAVQIEYRATSEDEATLNPNKTRIGGFKLWRLIDAVIFQEYWRADVTTSAGPMEPYQGWAIGFDVKTLKPTFFGELVFMCTDSRHPECLMYGILIKTGGHVGKLIPLGYSFLR
jgi:hypothetical protein